MSVSEKAIYIKQLVQLCCDVIPQIISLIVTVVKSINEIKTI